MLFQIYADEPFVLNGEQLVFKINEQCMAMFEQKVLSMGQFSAPKNCSTVHANSWLKQKPDAFQYLHGELEPNCFWSLENRGRDDICHKHHKQRLCKIITTRVKFYFVDVF